MDLVAGAVGTLISKLGEEYELLQSAEQRKESMVTELERMRAALRKLRGVPPDQLQDKEQLTSLVCDLRDESYAMEDAIDTFDVHDVGHQTLGKRLRDTVFGVIGMPSKRSKIAGNMRDISNRLEKHRSRYGRFKFADSIHVARAASRDPRRDAIDKQVSQPVGTEKSISELMGMVSPLDVDSQGREVASSSRNDHETERRMKKVSVVGQGGLGKTRLVQLLYDKLKVRGPVKFDCSAFVVVGQQPDFKRVFQDIIKQIDKEVYKQYAQFYRDASVDELIDELRETFLGNKKYLLVLDDIWETESWETIKLALVQENGGSRVITTTRILEVAEKSDDVYNLQKLPYAKSEELFRTILYTAEGRHPDNPLDRVSDQILTTCVNKCDGVPLAIITMASLLADKPSGEWSNICRSIDFCDKDNKDVSNTERILSRRYYDLPDHLKTCLLYLSTYPEDSFIEKNTLINKWVAEGFVQKKESTEFYEDGEGYFYELINRNIVEASDWDYHNAEGCRVHDMVLALLRHISQEQNFVIFSNNDDVISPSRRVFRLALQNRTVEPTHHDRHMDHLRSLNSYRCDYMDLSLARFKLLRVLALNYCRGSIDLGNLGSLLLLKYLSLRISGTNELPLPEGIGALKLLQTLELHGFSSLPSSVGQLTQLICLHAGSATVPNGVIEKLTSLEQLTIQAGPDTVGQFVKELGKLRKLRVLYAEMDVTEATVQSDLVESLGNLSKIQSLELNGSIKYIDEAGWETLVLPQTLQHLALLSIEFPALPSFINPSGLPNLSILWLTLDPPGNIFLDDEAIRSMDDEVLQTLGLLPELRHLRLSTGSTVLTIASANDGWFKKLRSLSLPHSMVQFVPKDMVLVTELGDFMPKLEVLEFYVHVDLMHGEGSCENLGLECIPSLQKVKVEFRCEYAFSDDVEKEEDAQSNSRPSQGPHIRNTHLRQR